MPEFGYEKVGDVAASSGGADVNETDLDTGIINNSGIGGNGAAADITIPIPDDEGNNEGNNGNGGNNGNNGVKPAKEGNGNNSNGEGNTDGIELIEGTNIIVGEDSYTVDKDGNLVDKEGKVFKEAKDVQEFIKSFDAIDNGEPELSIDTIKEKIGIDIVDETGKPIEFENTPEGIAAYVNSVVEQRQEEFAQAGINQLIEKYPIVEDVINYYVANGNSLEGFGEVKDRSNITIDENNTAQQEAIIRESFKEFNKRGNVDEYIQYLKDKGMLFNTAQEELQGLIEADKDAKEERAELARQAAIANQKETDEYWNEVQEVIKNRKFAGYQIPETIIINRDGKKIAATPTDFFNYVYQVDQQGNSRYTNDLAQLTPEQKRDDSLLRAYLRFTGSSYADLVNLAIKEKEVSTLRLRAKEGTKRTARIILPTTNKPNGDGNKFGYNH